jgi:hypothetical protein
MKRTKFPQMPTKQENSHNIGEILENLTNTENSRLLAIQTDIQSRLINIKKDSYRIGKLLTEAKQILPHGSFRTWIRHYFNEDLPYSTAKFYMDIYKTFEKEPNMIKCIPSKYLQMLVQNKFPDQVLKIIKENPEKFDRPALQQTNEVYQLFKEGKIGKSQFMILAEKQVKLGKETAYNREEHRINTNMRESFYRGGGDILKRIRELIKTARDMAGLFPYDPNSKEHEKLMKLIDEIVNELQVLKTELIGGRGFIKAITTKEYGAHFVDRTTGS